jgi:hypothetical protein
MWCNIYECIILTVAIFMITKNMLVVFYSSVVSQCVISIYFISGILLLLPMSLLYISTLWKHELACSFHISLVKYRQFIWQVSFNVKQKKNAIITDTLHALTQTPNSVLWMMQIFIHGKSFCIMKWHYCPYAYVVPGSCPAQLRVLCVGL